MKNIFLFFILTLLNHIVSAQDKKTQNTPIVFVHGFLGSGDTYATQFQRFTENGYLPSQLYAFDWNSVGARNNTIAQLDSFIAKVLEKTGAEQINLVGHSAGGGIGYSYLNDAVRALKVANYVHIGSSRQAKPAGKNGEVRTLNIFSLGDKVAKGDLIPGAVNIQQTDNDHYEVATSESTFWSMFQFFNPSGKTKPQKEIKRKFVVAGKACLMGENTILANALVEVYTIDFTKGERIASQPDFTFTTDERGSWGPFIAKPGIGYEFVLKPAGGQRTVHYFYEPFSADNLLVYLRALPKTGLPALLLNTLPSNDMQSVVAVFCSNRAVIAGRDSLTIDGLNLSAKDISPDTKTAIAHFIFDNGDGISSGNLISTFKQLPFMNGVDFFLNATDKKPVQVFYNGRTFYLPKRKSASEGIMVMVLK
ncbi:alpha/beta fold hydrolase [Sediminibacterium sp.]|uniref:alpha/beta fold hydrolase n=1 Tax=Sediminibacterium sp. TaxID=1917865 RepID=UPI003F6A2D81